ncbi:MAG: CDF family Co(II)/Ni(II) efflux transporter DmeF [Geminicoccaceae bacterium]|nr:CDF family Co(II)/Ni(II) efflux transporter DmeF [Geminicoccaceae bacterium]
MHHETIEPWRHDHRFLATSHDRRERRTWIVVALTAVTMVAEVVAGLLFGSMALLADGVHMATHAGALALAGFAYAFARRHADSPRFSFGTGKFGDLAAWSSALVLLVTALAIAAESAWRLFVPVAIRFDEAIAVALVGLGVNLVSALLLHGGAGHHRHDHPHGSSPDHAPTHTGRHRHDHARGASHRHDHGPPGPHAADERDGPLHEDHNLRAAYAHVVTDALTSVLAIVALVAGRVQGWAWLDAAVGSLAAALILRWTLDLLRRSGAVLLDTVPDERLAARIRERLERDGDRVADLHLWRLGPGHLALVVSVVTDAPATPDHYKARLREVADLSHVTVEVHPCARRLVA